MPLKKLADYFQEAEWVEEKDSLNSDRIVFWKQINETTWQRIRSNPDLPVQDHREYLSTPGFSSTHEAVRRSLWQALTQEEVPTGSIYGPDGKLFSQKTPRVPISIINSSERSLRSMLRQKDVGIEFLSDHLAIIPNRDSEQKIAPEKPTPFQEKADKLVDGVSRYGAVINQIIPRGYDRLCINVAQIHGSDDDFERFMLHPPYAAALLKHSNRIVDIAQNVHSQKPDVHLFLEGITAGEEHLHSQALRYPVVARRARNMYALGEDAEYFQHFIDSLRARDVPKDEQDSIIDATRGEGRIAHALIEHGFDYMKQAHGLWTKESLDEYKAAGEEDDLSEGFHRRHSYLMTTLLKYLTTNKVGLVVLGAGHYANTEASLNTQAFRPYEKTVEYYFANSPLARNTRFLTVLPHYAAETTQQSIIAIRKHLFGDR